LLINLHLGSWPLDQLDTSKFEYAVTRWIVSESAGVLDRIDFADNTNHNIKNFAILAKTGDVVSPPIENVNRLGYVMTANASREAAEYAADEFVSSSKIVLKH
jgi:L-amino acid ligase C-terminal domain 2